MEEKGRGPIIGKEFAVTYQMKDVINGYFELSKTPTFGQLGCSGFIFANGKGDVIHKATPAFMQYGPNAFQWVERMLSQYQPAGQKAGENTMDSLPLDAIRVILKGLKAQPHLNGLKGHVLRKDANNSDRFIILLDNGNQVSIKSTNFDELEEDEEEEEGEETDAKYRNGGCCGSNNSADCGNGSCSQPAPCSTTAVDLSDPSCSSAGCSDERLEKLLQQPTVLLNIPTIDTEHEECEQALQTFITQRTVTSLQSFHNILVKHFVHEEELMRDVGFGGAKAIASEGSSSNDTLSTLNAYSGHVADHHSIRDLIEQIIDSSKSDGIVCQGKVIKIVDRFKAHIDRYDTLYQQDFIKAGVQ